MKALYFYPSGIYILNFCKISMLVKHLNLEMLGKYIKHKTSCTELVGYTLTHKLTTQLYSTNPCFILLQYFNASYRVFSLT